MNSLAPKVLAGDPPHSGVFARLGPSRVHGVGVFAVAPIPKGADIFAADQADITWIDAATVATLSEALKRLYFDFGIARGELLGVPRNFDLLTVGWYLNQPPDGQPPNVGMTSDLNFFALRDISPGEELTTVYADYSSPP